MSKTKQWLTAVFLTATLGAALGLAADKGHSARNRQVRQQKRIHQGARSGELTRQETKRLERNAAKIHRSIRTDRRDDGRFTPRERVKAQHRLEHQSRAIAKQKHDDDKRNAEQ